MKKINVLIVFSDKSSLENIKSDIPNFINIDYLINPTIKILKQTIIAKKYVCIIPENFYSIESDVNKSYFIKNFNIFKILENLNIKYFGNRYISSLLFYDISSYITQNIKELHPKIISKDDINNLEYPLTYDISGKYFLRYIFTSNNIYNKNIFETLEIETNSLKSVFENNTDLEEILIYDYIENYHFVKFVIIGNPPYSIFLLINSNENEISENIVNSVKQESHKLFIKYHLRDYVEFTYIFSDSKIFLINIDISNIFNNYTYFMRKYNINILFVYLLVYFVRENDLLNLKTLYLYFLTNKSITILNELIPFELKKKMQIEYGYNDVIFELKKRILTNNEENKYQLISILNEAIDSLPNIEYSNYPFLDNKENNYSFLKKYDKFNDAPQNFQNVLNESLKILGGQVRWHVPTSLHNVDPSIMFNTVISSTIINLYNPCTMSASGSAGILKMEKKIILQFSKLIKWEVNNSGGIFTYGGKFCLIYAIKCGLNRIKNFDFNGNNPVIITSVINHYSIESVCNILGLKDTSVIRIPINKHGTIDFNLFEMELVKCIKNNTPIACVIFSGGNTTHCSIENIKTGKFIIYETFKNYNIQYRPFIYFDTVVCWPWLFFQDYNFKENHLSLPKETIDDIKKISSLICEANYADGIGIDFHKLGFCPLNNSLFITKNKLDLYSFAGKDNLTIKEPYQYSIDNSRGGAAIISAWNVLQSVGADGFRAYIANMLEIKNVFKTELKSNDFIIIDEKNTHGFALIFLCFSPLINKKDLKLYSLNDTQLIENNHYLYELSEHLKKIKNLVVI